MARSLTDLQAVLSELDGVEEAYIESPQTLKPPCILIEPDLDSVKYADNIRYSVMNGYTIIVVDRDVESLIPGQVANLPYSRFDRHYPLNGLHHFAYKLFF